MRKSHKLSIGQQSSLVKFWQPISPCYRSDYERSHTNGSVEQRFGLPGIACNVCAKTWGGSRVVSFE